MQLVGAGTARIWSYPAEYRCLTSFRSWKLVVLTTLLVVPTCTAKRLGVPALEI